MDAVIIANWFCFSAIDAFKAENVSETILRRLLSQDVMHHIKIRKEKDNQSLLIYEQGKPADYFVLILEGRVEVIVGQEHLMFECGPFTYFGTQALVQNVGVGTHIEVYTYLEYDVSFVFHSEFHSKFKNTQFIRILL